MDLICHSWLAGYCFKIKRLLQGGDFSPIEVTQLKRYDATDDLCGAVIMPFLYRAERLYAIRTAHMILWNEFVESTATDQEANAQLLAMPTISGNPLDYSPGSDYHDLESYTSHYPNKLDQALHDREIILTDAIRTLQEKPGHFFLLRYTSALISGSPFAPIWESLFEYSREVDYTLSSARSTFQMSAGQIIAEIPLLKDVFYYDSTRKQLGLHRKALKYLAQTFLNPFRLIDNILSFIHVVINRIADIGLTRYEETPLPQMIVKGTLGGVITLIRAPLAVLKLIGYIPYSLIENIFVKPIRYAYSAYNQKRLERTDRGHTDYSVYNAQQPVQLTDPNRSLPSQIKAHPYVAMGAVVSLLVVAYVVAALVLDQDWTLGLDANDANGTSNALSWSNTLKNACAPSCMG